MQQDSINNQNRSERLAVWAITPNGAKLAAKIAKSLPDVDLRLSSSLECPDISSIPFKRLGDDLARNFNKYRGHIFIMSTGIVVRLIAPLIRTKTEDPAVVVADESGYHAISLLSGHIGGANSLAEKIALLTGAVPVITTATDLNRVPAVDLIAKEKNLFIENPGAIKWVSSALLSGRKIYLHDPFGFMKNVFLAKSNFLNHTGSDKIDPAELIKKVNKDTAGIFIDDIIADLPFRMLVLRPPTIVAGIGCNRNTSLVEIKSFLYDILRKYRLSEKSLKSLATIDLKMDEPGLLALGKTLDLQIKFFGKDELNQVQDIKRPSLMVEKHMGVKSVCEAAAILASKKGKLIVPKESAGNVTIAIARIPFT